MWRVYVLFILHKGKQSGYFPTTSSVFLRKSTTWFIQVFTPFHPSLCIISMYVVMTSSGHYEVNKHAVLTTSGVNLGERAAEFSGPLT